MYLPFKSMLYELRRSLLRPSVLVIIAVLVLVGLGSVASIAPAPLPVQVAREWTGVYYYSGGAYHIDFLAFDNYGHPLPQVYFEVLFISEASGGGTVANVSGRTGPNGVLDLTVSLPQADYFANYQAGPKGEMTYWETGNGGSALFLSPTAEGTVEPFGVPITDQVYAAVEDDLAYQVGLQVYFLGANGTSPDGDRVYYALVDQAGAGSPYSPLPASSMTELGFLDSTPQYYRLVIPSAATGGDGKQVQIEIFSNDGSLLAEDTNQSTNYGWAPTPLPPADNVAFSYFEGDVGPFTPMMAIIGAYSMYGRDRVSGVLDSILAQPVTRRGLAVSRYAAAMIALASSMGLSLAVTDGVLGSVVGSYVSSSDLLAFFLGTMATMAFFVGLVFVLSHLSDSSSVVLAVSIGIFELFALSWYETTDLLSGVWPQSLTIDYVNPVRFPGMVWAVASHDTVYDARPVASLGLGEWPVFVAGVVWAVVPLIALFVVLRARD